MKKAIVFGATGNVGRKVVKQLALNDYRVTAVLRSVDKLQQISQYLSHYFIADIKNRSELNDICKSQDIVISTLGKSVSPNVKDNATFMEIDFEANRNILDASIQNNVSKFVYLSAIHSEYYQHLMYFKAHHDFSELVKNSGIDYSIIKVPAIYSAFLDIMDLAKNGHLVTLGDGQCKTNPIYEGDVAKVIINAIESPYSVVEAGGTRIYTRKQINELIQQAVNPSKKCRHVPVFLVRLILPFIKIFDRNTYDKFAFFLEVTQHDIIAPMIGELSLEEYIHKRVSHS